MLYKIAKTNKLLLVYKGQLSFVSPTIILPIKFKVLESRKHKEHIIVEPGPNCLIGN